MMKPWEPYITTRAVQPVVSGFEMLGYRPEEILTAGNISRAALEDADGRIPHQAMMAVWEQGLALTKDPFLGIHLAEAAPIQSFGVHTYALLSSPTLREAYRRACRYQRLIHEVTDLHFIEEETEGILQHALPGGRPVSRHPAEFLATLWVRFGRLIAGDTFVPSQVCFAHPTPAETGEYERLFQAPVHFSSGRTAMHMSNDYLDIPNATADAGLTGVLDDYAERLLTQLPRQATMSERVRSQLLEDLRGGTPTADGVAQALHISVRTLHRSLRSEETSFGALLNQLRQEQATKYLADPKISIAEVGFLLGFSELSSFYRAFKRWTGKTPADFRAGNG